MPTPHPTAKQRHDLAYTQGVQRTIPTSRTPVTVAATVNTVDLSTYSGKYIFLKAVGADVTILRDGGAGTLTTSTGLTLATTDPREEMFVDPGGEMMLSHIASGAATLVILYDAE